MKGVLNNLPMHFSFYYGVLILTMIMIYTEPKKIQFKVDASRGHKPHFGNSL
jgi:hypothetical protein